jgi:hypothetical protein
MYAREHGEHDIYTHDVSCTGVRIKDIKDLPDLFEDWKRKEIVMAS